MPEDNNDRRETDRGREMQDRQNALGPQPVNPEQFSEAGTYMEPNAAQIPWPNMPYDPADSRANPDSEIEGQSEELTGKKPTKDRFGNPIEEVEAPRGEPQNVAGGIAYNPPTADELAEQDKQRRGQTRREDRQEQRQQPEAQYQDQGQYQEPQR
jgi:hypothetical protein